MIRTFALLLVALFTLSFAPTLKFAVLKYNGGGDWYSNPTSVTNLITFCNKNLHMNIDPIYDYVEVGNKDIYKYPFVHMTGHGNVVFSESEAKNLREYLISGGFLHIDDNYGMDLFVRVEMKKVFPELDWVELPANHPVFNQKYKFPNGLPKIHEHDNKPPQAFGLIHQGRLLCLYTYESDLGDGWEDPSVHKDSEEMRQNALKMGSNIIQYICQ